VMNDGSDPFEKRVVVDVVHGEAVRRVVYPFELCPAFRQNDSATASSGIGRATR
jgi:hypothetical protein